MASASPNKKVPSPPGVPPGDNLLSNRSSDSSCSKRVNCTTSLTARQAAANLVAKRILRHRPYNLSQPTLQLPAACRRTPKKVALLILAEFLQSLGCVF